MKLRTNLALLHEELCSWDPTLPSKSACVLAVQYNLDLQDVLIQARLVGYQLAEVGTPQWVDPNADTVPITVGS